VKKGGKNRGERATTDGPPERLIRPHSRIPAGAKWALQYKPHDNRRRRDQTEASCSDMTVGRHPRKVLLHPEPQRVHLSTWVGSRDGEIVLGQTIRHVQFTVSQLRISRPVGPSLTRKLHQGRATARARTSPTASGLKDWKPPAVFSVRPAECTSLIAPGSWNWKSRPVSHMRPRRSSGAEVVHHARPRRQSRRSSPPGIR